MNPTLPSGLYSLLKVGALTFFGALLGAISMTSIPTTLDGWKALILPALGVAVAAELVFLRTTISQLLAQLTGTTPPAPPAQVVNVTTNTKPSGFSLVGLVVGLFAAAVLGIALVTLLGGCLVPPSPAQQIQDGKAVADCVSSHWGEPVVQIAGECVGSEVQAAIDLIADVEAVIELVGGTQPSASPYANEPRVMALVPAKVANLRAARAARGGK